MARLPRKLQTQAANCLVVMMVWVVCCISPGSGSSIHICSERQGSAVMVQEGLPIEICCSIQRLVCQRDDSVSLMDSLTLLPEGVDESSLDAPVNMTDSVEIGVDGHFEMRRLDECHVELLVKNPSPEGIPLNLVCRFKGAVMESTPLRVVPKPRPYVTQIISTPSKLITVLFDRGPAYDRYTDDYSIKMVEHFHSGDLTTDLCHLNHYRTPNASGLECQPGESTCECQYQVPRLSRYNVVRNADVTFTITVKRVRWQVDVDKTVNLINHIQPEAPLEVEIDDVSPFHVTAKFCQPTLTSVLRRFMSRTANPLEYRIELNKTSGYQETIRMEFPASRFFSCIKQDLPDLTPYMTYNLATSFSGGGGEGPRMLTEFTTGKSAPLRPPSIEKFAFSRDSHSLRVLWQSLPLEDQGGDELTYDLEVWSQDKIAVNATGIMSISWLTTQPLPSGPLGIRLWARNEIGRSENFSTLDIPAESVIRQVHSQVEISRDRLRVHLHSSETGVFKQIVLHLCKTSSRKDDVNLCTMYPQTLTLSEKDATDYNGGASNFHSFYLSSITKTNFTSRQRPFQVEFYGSEFTDPTTRTVSGSVETGNTADIGWVSIEHEAFFDAEEDEGSSEQSEASGDLKEEGRLQEDGGLPKPMAVVRKRSAILSRYDAISRPRQRRSSEESVLLTKLGVASERPFKVNRRLFAWSDIDTNSDSGNDTATEEHLSTPGPDSHDLEEEVTEFYRVFVSGQAHDGTWLGMTEAQCYFSMESDKFDLVISQVPYSDFGPSDEPGLPKIRWMQKCNSMPKQHLVEKYEVFVSGDEACKQNMTPVSLIDNQIFKPSLLQVPSGWPFVCVRGLSSDDFLPEVSVKSIDQLLPAGKGSSNRTGLVVGITLPCAFLAALVLLVCFFRYRKGWKKAKEKELKIQQMLDGDCETKKDLKVKLTQSGVVDLSEQKKWTSDQSGLARTENGDSGRGTLYNQGSNNNSSRKVKQDSTTPAHYAIQVKADPPRKENEGIVGRGGTSEGASEDSSGGHSDGSHKIWVIEESNATSDGNGWCDSGSHGAGLLPSSGGSFDVVADVTSAGSAWLDNATSNGSAWLDNATSNGSAWLDNATSNGSAWLDDVTSRESSLPPDSNGGGGSSGGFPWSGGRQDHDNAGLLVRGSRLLSQEEEILSDCSSPVSTKPLLSRFNSTDSFAKNPGFQPNETDHLDDTSALTSGHSSGQTSGQSIGQSSGQPSAIESDSIDSVREISCSGSPIHSRGQSLENPLIMMSNMGSSHRNVANYDEIDNVHL